MCAQPGAGFEDIFAGVLLRFVDAQAGRVDAEIRAAQRLLCEFFQLDRSVVWEVVPGSPVSLRLRHLWNLHSDGPHLDVTTGAALDGEELVYPLGDGITPVRADVDGAALFPWTVQRVLNGTTVAVARLDDLPAEAAADAASLRRFKTRSTVVVPMRFGGAVTGVLTFATTQSERAWPDDLVARFEFLGRVFASALGRMRAEDDLLASEARVGLAATAAGAGFWEIDLHSRRVRATPEARSLYGLPLDESLTLERLLDVIHPDDQPMVQERLRGGGNLDGGYAAEYRIALADGRTRWVRVHGRQHAGSPGRPARLAGIAIDITDRKEQEVRLRAALEDLQRLEQQLQRENISLREEVKSLTGPSRIVGNSAAIRRALDDVARVAPAATTVLLLGETGTGKELFAEAIHNHSPRRERRMVRVNCAAIPTTLIESELFGREKGAYTGALSSQAGRFELAHGSTLFLDEVGELPLDVQAKLLRVLEDKQVERLGGARPVAVDVRIIAATNRDLDRAVRDGTFREELYYRLNVFPINIPPLRDRAEDIPLLVKALVEELSAGVSKRFETVFRADVDALLTYQWPGNVRELRNIIERAMIVSAGPCLRILPPQAPSGERPSPARSLQEVEREHVLTVLGETGWRVAGPRGAARILGLRPTTLEHRMKKLGITRPDSAS